MAKRIRINPPKIYPMTDFNYNPFMDNNEDVKSVFPGDHAYGFFKFSKLPQVGDTIVVNGVTFTFVNNTGGAVAATGYFGFTTTPVDGDVITVNGVAFTFKDAPSGAVQIQTDADKDVAGANAASVLNASVNASVTPATYSYDAATDRLNVVHDTPGAAGNSFTLAKTSTHLTVSGATLTGGQTASGAIGLVDANSVALSLGEVVKATARELNESTNSSVDDATYVGDNHPGAMTVNVYHDTAGEAGEAFTLAVTGTAVTRSGANLELGKVAHPNVIRLFMD